MITAGSILGIFIVVAVAVFVTSLQDRVKRLERRAEYVSDSLRKVNGTVQHLVDATHTEDALLMASLREGMANPFFTGLTLTEKQVSRILEMLEDKEV